MKKVLFAFTLLLSMVVLSACGETETENVEGTVNNTQEESESTDTAEESKEESSPINQLIVEDESIKATLVDIVKVKDETWGNEIRVKFEIENKTDKTLEVQAREVSADGKMVDDTLISMSQEISAGKVADAILTISEFDGYTFPELTNDFEMILHVFDWENYELELDYPVSVSF